MEQTLEKWSLDRHYKSIHVLGENSSKEESLTPINIVNQMVETILQTVDITIVKNPNFKVLDPACGTGSFLIAWYEVLSKYHSHEHIINNMLWGFETNFSYFRANNKYYQFKNVYKESFLETNKLDNMKFDVIVGNPPYKGKGNPLHLQFLSKCYSITKEKGILSFVQPATFLLDQKKINNFYKDARYLISKDLVSVDIYPKSIFENAAINTAISISLIHKDRNNKTPISVKYVSLNKIVHFEDIELINQFASNETFHSIKNKVIEYCNRFGSLQNKYVDGEFSKYLVPISKLQRYKFNGDEAVLLNNSSNNSGLSFTNKKLAHACLEYLNTPFSKFCLHIYKLDMNLTSGRNLRSVPLFNKIEDFKNPYSALDLSDNEIEFIEWVNLHNNKLFFFS